jgi:hypothetical protein
MSTKDNELLQSLVEYVNDVKPYHTKFREITSELFFSDSFNANIRDTHSIEIFLQNVWDRDSIGGESLVRMCSNIDVDRFFNLPPTVYPRFTTIIKNSAEQIPVEVMVLDVKHEILKMTDNGVSTDIEYKILLTIDDSNESKFGWNPETIQIFFDNVPYLGTYVKKDSVITLSDTFTKTFQSDIDPTIRSFVNSIKITPISTAKTIIINNPGIGYRENDVISVKEGVFEVHNSSPDPTKILVKTVKENGGVTSAEIFAPGRYIGIPQNPVKTDRIYHDGSTTYDENPYGYEHYGEKSFGEGSTFSLTWDKIQRFFSETLSTLLKSEIQLRFNPEKILVMYLHTGRYSVPFHQGSKVFVNEIEQEFITDYTIDKTRGFIQFLKDKHPHTAELQKIVRIEIFKSDRLFISYHDPFQTNGNQINGYDTLSYGNIYDSFNKDTFIIEIDDSFEGKNKVTFYNTEPGTNKAGLVVNSVNCSNGTIYKVEAIGPWKFTVQKVYPTIEQKKIALFKTLFSDGEISFIIDRKWNQSYIIEQDTNSYLDKYDGVLPYDESEFFSDLSATKEHGDESSLMYHPVKYNPIGKVVKREDGYKFILNDIPKKNSYIELRIDQVGQFDQLVNASFSENLRIFVVESTNLFDHHGYGADMYDFEGDCVIRMTVSGNGYNKSRIIATSISE